MSPIPDPDFGSQRFKSNPFPYYARLREEAPIFRFRMPGRPPGYLVTRYDDVATLLKHPSFAKDFRTALTPEQIAHVPWLMRFFEPMMKNMLSHDPPDHTRLRALVHKAFTPRLVERLRGRVQALTGELVDAGLRKGGMDLVTGYALPVPSTIIAEMLGVPASDHAKFQRWSNRLVSGVSMLDLVSAIPAITMFRRYIRKLIERRRSALGDDLLSAMLQAEEAGSSLTPDELVSMVFLLLVAGHETTVNLIAGGTLALLQHPEQLERLRADPSLMPSAVEELLRYASPVENATERFTREEITLGGTTIPRGSVVFAVLASANRDPKQFPDPDALDLGREPNRHVAFGLGIHYCLGAPLARLEGQIAIQTLLDRMPRMKLAKPVEALRWRTGLVTRGPRYLPVAA